MNGSGQQEMNVARPRGSGKSSAWIALASFLVLGLILLIHRPAESVERNAALVMVAILAVNIGVWSLLHAMAAWSSPVYYWDEEQVKWKRLWRERSMRWSDVSTVQVKEAGGQVVYILTDAWGHRLSLNIEPLGMDHPLRSMLNDKLSHLVEGQLQQAEAAGDIEFPVRFLGLYCRTFVLRHKSLLVKERRRSREMPLEDLSEVRQNTRRHDWDTYHEAELVWKDGSRTRIPHFTTGSFRLLESLRSRAPNAVWFQTRGPEPQDKAASIAFWRYRVESLRKSMKTLWRADVALLSAVGWVIWKIARRGWQIPPELEAELRWTWPILALPFALSILAYAKYPRRLRTLQHRLAALEADEESAPHDETNRQLTEED